MRITKFLILILGLSLTAASCDLAAGVFDLGSGGVRGVLKSEDAGETFHSVNQLNVKGDISGLTVNAMVFDRTNPEIMYIASGSGIYKSENGAKTWRYILSGINAVGVVLDPYSSSIIYTAGIVGQNGKIIKSLDGGVSWVDIYTEPSTNNAVVAIALSDTNSSLVIAGLNTGEIIRSIDGGHTWQAAKNFSERIMRIRFGSSGSVYALTSHKGFYKSMDQGLTWNLASSVLSSDSISNAGQAPSSVTAFYDLALDQKQFGVLYLGSEQGLIRSVNDGGTWSFVSLPVKNASLRVSSVAVNPNNSNNIFVAVGSTVFKSLNGGLTWETRVLQTGSEVRTILINPQTNNVLYLGLGARR